MAPDTVGEQDLRAESVSRVVTGFALQEYKLKQLCMIQSSKAWTETYYRETAADLTGKDNTDSGKVKGVPRLANFPYGEVSWEQVKGRNLKHGMEAVISWEDAKTNAIDVIGRTLLRIARAITKSVDTVIATAILTGTNTVSATPWDDSVTANRDPIQNILDAKAKLEVKNYNPNRNGFLVVHPTDYSHLLGNANIRNAGQFYTDSVTRNGVVGRLLGLTVISSNSVTENGAQVVIAKESMTWKSVVGLTVKTIEDPGIKYTIRAWEVGQIQVTNPNAICLITTV